MASLNGRQNTTPVSENSKKDSTKELESSEGGDRTNMVESPTDRKKVTVGKSVVVELFLSVKTYNILQKFAMKLWAGCMKAVYS